jgi:hypothetical protein
MVTDFASRFQELRESLSDNDEHPQFLYRYRSCQTDYFIEEMSQAIRGHQLFFPSQAALNDPVDCRPFFRKGCSLREYRLYLHPVINTIRTVMAQEGEGQVVPEVLLRRWVRENIEADSWKTIKECYEEQLANLVEFSVSSTTVLSLSKSNNNDVMWSMYGARGNGVCLEMDIAGFCLYAPDHNGGMDRLCPVQVRYSKERPTLNYYGVVAGFLKATPWACRFVPSRCHARLLDGLRQTTYVRTKQERWSYEEEFRLILSYGYERPLPGEFGSYVKVGPNCLKAIYFGDRVGEDTISTVTALANENGSIPLFRARPSATGYGYVFDRVHQQGIS